MVRELTLILTGIGGAMTAFPPDAYVVRYGGRGMLRGLAGLLVTAAVVAYCVVYPRSAVSQVIGFLFATIRYAYRRMSGWRVDPQRLAVAVASYAPSVPVINGQNYPPRLSPGDAQTARRNR